MGSEWDAECQEQFDKCDKNGDGKISKNELFEILKKLINGA